MVTTQEAREELEESRTQLKTEETSVRQRVLRSPTRSETLGVATRRREIKAQRREQAAPLLKNIESRRTQLKSRERDIERVEEENKTIAIKNKKTAARNKALGVKIRELESAKKFAGTTFIGFLSKEGQARAKDEESRIKAIAEFKSQQKRLPETITIKELPPVKVTGGVRPISMKETTFPTTFKQDIFTLKEQVKARQLPTAVKTGFDIIGKTITAGVTVPLERFTGLKIKQPTRAKAAEVVGSVALFSGLLTPFPTRGQIIKDISFTKVKVVGVSQDIGKGGASTRLLFEAKKKGLRQVGSIKAITAVKPTKTGLFKIQTAFQGVGAKRAATFPKGLTLKEPSVFVGTGKGIGAGTNKKFASIIAGKIGVASKTGQQAVKFVSGGIQAGSSKGVVVAGGTVSTAGTAKTAGLIFKIPTQPKTFIPLAAKGGQALITLPKTAITTLPIQSLAGFAGARAGAEAFASTLTPSFSTLGIAPALAAASSLIKTPKFSTKGLGATLQPIPIPKTIPTTNLGISTGSVSLSIPKLDAPTRQRGRQTQRQLSIPKQIPGQAIIPKQISIPRALPRLRQPTPQRGLLKTTLFGGLGITPTPITPKIKPPPLLPLFKFPKARPPKRKRKDPFGFGSLSLSPSLTAAGLGLTRKVTPKQARALAISPDPIGIRRLLILK